eukprot:m.11211 g.11211  ORF g.11211 m.11211 type:complete len:547 (+) comp4399_c0_seq1:131-1771(+)
MVVGDRSPLIKSSTEDPRGDGKIPFMTKFAFALGAIPNQIIHTVIGFFLTSFLLDVVNLSASVTSIAMLFGRAWDAVTDPMIGFLVQRTHTKWGSLKPWIICSFLPLCAAYAAIWCVPRATYVWRATYAIGAYLLIQTFITGFAVPLSALTMHLSHNPKERDKAITWAMVSAVLATLIGATAQGQITSAMFGPIGAGCANCTLLQNTSKSNQPQTPIQWQIQETFIVGGVAVAVLCAICALFVIFFVPEQKRTAADEHLSKLSLLTCFKIVFGTRSFLYLVMMQLWAWMSVGIAQANLILFLRYALNLEKYFQDLMLTLLLSTMGCVPIFFILLTKLGKKKSFTIGLVMLSGTFLSTFFLPKDMPVYIMHIILCLMGCAISAVYLLPNAMLPDVIEDATVRNKGDRHEVLFYSFFVFTQKFGTGVAVALATAALDTFGKYKNGCCEQDPIIVTILRIVQGPVCATLAAMSLIATLFYPLTSQRVAKNKVFLAQLHEKREEHRKEILLGSQNVDHPAVPSKLQQSTSTFIEAVKSGDTEPLLGGTEL